MKGVTLNERNNEVLSEITSPNDEMIEVQAKFEVIGLIMNSKVGAVRRSFQD